MNKKTGTVLSALALFISTQAFATAYHLPAEGHSLIGGIQYATITQNTPPAKITKRYDIGFNSLENANPELKYSGAKAGMEVKIPTKHLLPNEARKGIVINLPEMRMYYYPEGTNKVLTYPIGIGKLGKTIPITMAKVTKKTINPTWVPPDDIREFNLEQGIVLPKIMPPGRDNPLGPYAIYMSVPTYLIHSTIFPESIGRRASFGCIRMYESDIEEFFPSVEKGVSIAIINTPVKVNWHANRLYIEAHTPLEEHQDAYDASLPGMVHEVTALTYDQNALIDWQLIAYLAKERDGIPHEVGIKIR